MHSLFKFRKWKAFAHDPDSVGQNHLLLEILAVLVDIREIVHRKYKPAYVRFSVNDQSLILLPNRMNKMSLTKLSIGHNAAFAWTQLDQNGNPMLTPVPADAPPTWSNNTSATETITPAADGLSAQGTTLAVGTDTVMSTGSFGGVTFTVTADIEVDAAPQVLTSARLDVTVV